ncbi:MAG: hypothetical protein E4H14_01415 [Candidatus Thorarchaeota archaeon]|nr:MAG: hypothetical protein E4H14_01415 [Candidatus Thorarchaeota archaeon]
MGDLEEVLNRKFLLIDTWDVRHQHLLITAFSVLLLITYGAFMWLLCSMTPNITSSLLLLGSQIGLGLPVTRAFYDFGVASRKTLKFYDAGVLGNDIDYEDLRINIGDMPLVFEKLDFQIQKYDSGALDDLNDLVWFAIIIWAVISSAGIFTDLTGIPMFLLGTIVLGILCFISYSSGYRTIQGFSFEEDLQHLEYYLDTFVREVDAVMPEVNGQVTLQTTKQGRQSVLIDIIVEFALPSDSVIEFHLGLSSLEKERIIIVAPPKSLDIAYSKFNNLPFVKDSEWILERITTQSGLIVRIVNSETKLCICDRSTFVINPEHVEKNVIASKEIFSAISAILQTSLNMN